MIKLNGEANGEKTALPLSCWTEIAQGALDVELGYAVGETVWFEILYIETENWLTAKMNVFQRMEKKISEDMI